MDLIKGALFGTGGLKNWNTGSLREAEGGLGSPWESPSLWVPLIWGPLQDSLTWVESGRGPKAENFTGVGAVIGYESENTDMKYI